MNNEKNSDRDYVFWNAHNGNALVWSNPNASDSVMIANALLKPSFHLLLNIADRFGVNRLKNEWEALQAGMLAMGYAEEAKRLESAKPIVTRCLNHFEEALKTK